ncbi:hypothetical protein HOY82DRAFT_669443 [Tuber indicum]|nr:hypothetical protein HOY82DRAFT_669443 [Tuber indicum]
MKTYLSLDSPIYLLPNTTSLSANIPSPFGYLPITKDYSRYHHPSILPSSKHRHILRLTNPTLSHDERHYSRLYIRKADIRSRKAEVLSLEEKYKSDVEAFRQEIKDLHTEMKRRQQELLDIGGTICNQMSALRKKQYEQASEMAVIRNRQGDLDGYVEWVRKATGGLVEIAQVGAKRVTRVEVKLGFLEEKLIALRGDIINPDFK